MATNSCVSVSAGLLNTAQTPHIGASALSAAPLAFTEGDMAIEKYVDVASTPTALNASLAGDGFLLIANPGPLAISLLCASQAMGSIPAGTTTQPFAVVVPAATGIIYNATVATGTQSVYVCAVKTSANS